MAEGAALWPQARNLATLVFRPAKTKYRLGYSQPLQQVIADFGADNAFGHVRAKLKEHYGGPAPGGRSYDETFEIKLDGQQKKVIYHHHPTAEPMPEELVKLRTELFRLVHQKFRLNAE